MSVQSRQVQSKVVISGDFNYSNVLLLQISFHSVGTSLQSVNLYFQIKSSRDQHLLYQSYASINLLIIIVNLIHILWRYLAGMYSNSSEYGCYKIKLQGMAEMRKEILSHMSFT